MTFIAAAISLPLMERRIMSGDETMNNKEKRLKGLFTIHYSPFTDKGFTYMAAMTLVVVMGITLSMAGKYWSTMAIREREAELLFRGDQIRRGIELYYQWTAQKHGGAGLYPESLEELVKSKYSMAPKRSLRRIYEDPVTGEADWVIISDPASKRIMGVHSASDMEPLKTSNFTLLYRDFEGKKKYSDWAFSYKPQSQGQPKK